MDNNNHNSERIPRSRRRFRFSRALIGLLLATAGLVVLLIFSTLQNINRAQVLMERFLRDKGETIMRSIEAGSRATMMHNMGRGDPLHTLLAEYAKDRDIQSIAIIDTAGSVTDQVGAAELPLLDSNDIDTLVREGGIVTRLDRENGIYILAGIFQAGGPVPGMHMHGPMMNRRIAREPGTRILSVGLRTRQFDQARRQDVSHALFMGAILLLVGSGGLYFLFLYQRMRLTSANLADMKLYTDNVLESIPVGIITIDAGERIVSCNGNAENLFGLGVESARGSNIHELLPDCSQVVAAGCLSHREYEAECRDSSGKTVPLRTSCSPLVNDEGEHIGKVLILRDMSVIKEMEMQLERSRRMAALGKMAAGIAHEIRNPLGTLRGFAQYFGNLQQPGENGRQYADLMISEIDRLNETISALLQFSRPREPQLSEVSLDDLFAKAVSMMEADLASRDIELLRPQATGITVAADPDLLLQVLMNLVKNSINAIEGGGRISLACREDEGEVALTVADTGCGMSEDVRQRMFDPFYTTTKTGTGLGLAVSHQIVEQHGGSFQVETKPQAGTTITIILPQR